MPKRLRITFYVVGVIDGKAFEATYTTDSAAQAYLLIDILEETASVRYFDIIIEWV